MRPLVFVAVVLFPFVVHAGLIPAHLRTEWLPNPECLDAEKPRLSWRVEAPEHGQKQTAYRVLVAASAEELAKDGGDLWDSGKVANGETLNIAYDGKALASGQPCFWKVKVWDKDGVESAWSGPAQWTMGLLKADDWTAQWISFKDETPLHADRSKLHLPSARHYRKIFELSKPVKRATLYLSALGLAEPFLNGQRIGDAYFESGWADYRQRSLYRAHDVTKLLFTGEGWDGENQLGVAVADGWYAGYVGYGLLVGYGPNRTGRNIYGKTPALLAQLEVEFSDGSRTTIGSDESWQVTEIGPIREGDLLMGETFDARQDDANWCRPRTRFLDGPNPQTPWTWLPAIRAERNGSVKAKFYEPGVEQEREFGFVKPAKLAAYTAPPIRVTEELPAKKITEPKPGVFIFDFGQNFAGNVRLKVKGAAGTKLTLRYGEMLHRDGRLMTENLRRARATDTYILRGDPAGETWTPRFTYHGFQYCEVTGLAEKPELDLLTGLVLNNDTPIVGDFACSDDVMTQFWRNTVRTQKANFIEVPTDCPQRDERLGWMGDAQIYVRTASYNADVAAFFTKWVDDVREAQRDSGAYPDYAPYPFAHGAPGATHGTAWTDAGVIVPYTMWEVYGDRQLIERHWDSMTKFMDWRAKADPDLEGVKLGNTWGDWLNVNEDTPIEYIDLCYHYQSARMMRDMARALGRKDEAEKHARTMEGLRLSFRKHWLAEPNASVDHLKVRTQTAHVLALANRFFDPKSEGFVSQDLVGLIEKNGFCMATGFLGTKPLLPVLSDAGRHDLACRLFQSRKFPSWGYEVEQGATSVWERWDSFTKEHGFDGATGKNNAAMNSFSHYSFGAVMEWAFQTLAGIDTEGAGFQRILIRPNVPSAQSNPDGQPLTWVRASYEHPRGKIASAWKREGSQLVFEIAIPANTTAAVHLPAGEWVGEKAGILSQKELPDRTILEVGSGSYRFTVTPR